MRNPIRYIITWIVRIQERPFDTPQMIITIIVGLLIAAIMFPIAMSQLTGITSLSTKTTHTQSSINSAATTTWASGLTTLIITILPVLVIVVMAIHMFGFVTETNEYGDRVIVRGQNYYQQYEQNAIESELIDMYNYFKSDT